MASMEESPQREINREKAHQHAGSTCCLAAVQYLSGDNLGFRGTRAKFSVKKQWELFWG